MARFISRYGSYSHGVREEVVEVFAQGRRVMVRGLEAKFDTRGLSAYDREQGLTKLSHHGQLEDRVEGGNYAPTSRLSLFDSKKAQKENRWSDEETDLVVDALRNSPMLGIEFIEVSEPKRPAPWTGYDDIDDVERLLAAIELTGVDAAEVLTYERENADREEVVAALQDLLGVSADEEPVVIDAT